MGQRIIRAATPLFCAATLMSPVDGAAQPAAPFPAPAEAFHPLVEGRSARAPRRSAPKAEATRALRRPAPPRAPSPILTPAPAAPRAPQSPAGSALGWFGAFCIALSGAFLLGGLLGPHLRRWAETALQATRRSERGEPRAAAERPAAAEEPAAAQRPETRPLPAPPRVARGRAMTPIRIVDLLDEASPRARRRAALEAAETVTLLSAAPIAPAMAAAPPRPESESQVSELGAGEAEEAGSRRARRSAASYARMRRQRWAETRAARVDEARWEEERQREELARRSADLARRIQRFSQTPAGRRR